jgi:hypothetical protein
VVEIGGFNAIPNLKFLTQHDSLVGMPPITLEISQLVCTFRGMCATRVHWLRPYLYSHRRLPYNSPKLELQFGLGYGLHAAINGSWNFKRRPSRLHVILIAWTCVPRLNYAMQSCILLTAPSHSFGPTQVRIDMTGEIRDLLKNESLDSQRQR